MRTGRRTSAGDSDGKSTLALFSMRGRRRTEVTEEGGRAAAAAAAGGDNGPKVPAAAKTKKKGKRAGKQAGMLRNAQKWLRKQKQRGQDG